jgi:hypothetical protein
LAFQQLHFLLKTSDLGLQFGYRRGICSMNRGGGEQAHASRETYGAHRQTVAARLAFGLEMLFTNP